MSVPVPHRPYSKIKGTEPSVTTILGVLGKPGLSWAAAKETALFAVLHPEHWQHLPEGEAVDRLRKHHHGLWQSRAAVGTFTHSVAEVFADGGEIDVDALLDWALEHDSGARLWQEQNRDDLLEMLLGYVMGVEAWWQTFQPRIICAEAVVRTPGVYIGQTDLRARVYAKWPSDGFEGEQDVLIDYKSTAKQDEGSGIYMDSWCPQLHAYAFATERVHYEATEDAKGRVTVREVSTEPWTPPERLAVVHLRGDERADFYEVPIDKQHHDAFLAMAHLYGWQKRVPKPVTIGAGEGQ